MKDYNVNIGQLGQSRPDESTPAALTFDAGDYIADIEDFDLTEAEAREVLSTLFAIMRAFVELGFKHDVCGQVFGETPGLLLDGVDRSEPLHDQAAP